MLVIRSANEQTVQNVYSSRRRPFTPNRPNLYEKRVRSIAETKAGNLLVLTYPTSIYISVNAISTILKVLYTSTKDG